MPWLLLLSALLLPPTARAANGLVGVNLSWDDCNTRGVLNKDFACSTNSAAWVLVPSAVVPPITPTAMYSIIQFLFYGQVPNWWALQAGGCRAGAFTTTPGAGGLTGCFDYWGSRPSTSIASWRVLTNSDGPIGYQIILVSFTDPQNAAFVPSGTEIYGGRILIDARGTAETDSCTGCSLRLCPASC